MSTRQTAAIAGAVSLAVCVTVLALLWRYGIWRVMIWKMDLRAVLWPSSIMVTVGWNCTVAGIMTTICSIVISCLLYVGIALLLRHCFNELRDLRSS